MRARVDALAALSLVGAESLAFAQRICASDVSALADGEWQWSCLLSPKGRVLSLFRLWRRADDVLTLVLPTAALEATRTLLGRYLLRAKVTVEPERAPLWTLPVPCGEASRRVTQGTAEKDPTTSGARMVSTDGRCLFLANLPDTPFPDASPAWRARELAQGVPWIEADATDAFTPQALSLDRLAAFSVRKGCYPGQEIVARMHFLGQNKRELRRFASSTALIQGAALVAATDATRELGRVVNAALADGRTELLAVCQSVTADTMFCAKDAPDTMLQSLALEPPPLPVASAQLAQA